MGIGGAERLGPRHPGGEVVQRRQELVQRRVDEPDDDGAAVHGREDLGEVLPLPREQGVQRGLRSLVVGGEDQPLDQAPPVAEEHVLGAAQPDSLCAEPAGAGSVLGGVGVGVDPEPPDGVGVAEQPVTAGTRRSARRPVLPRGTGPRATGATGSAPA